MTILNNKIIAVAVNKEEFDLITGFCKLYYINRSKLMRDLTMRYINNYKKYKEDEE